MSTLGGGGGGEGAGEKGCAACKHLLSAPCGELQVSQALPPKLWLLFAAKRAVGGGCSMIAWGSLNVAVHRRRVEDGENSCEVQRVVPLGGVGRRVQQGSPRELGASWSGRASRPQRLRPSHVSFKRQCQQYKSKNFSVQLCLCRYGRWRQGLACCCCSCNRRFFSRAASRVAAAMASPSGVSSIQPFTSNWLLPPQAVQAGYKLMRCSARDAIRRGPGEVSKRNKTYYTK